jgi:hypothetical protein
MIKSLGKKFQTVVWIKAGIRPKDDFPFDCRSCQAYKIEPVKMFDLSANLVQMVRQYDLSKHPVIVAFYD